MKTVFEGKLFTIKQGKAGEVPEIAERPPTVCVIPITKDGKIIMTREYRKEQKGTVNSFILGRADKGGTLEEEARRELAEEGKLKARNLKLFYKDKPSHTLKWDTYYYVATGLEPAEAELDEDEVIEPFETTLEQACELVFQDDFREEGMAYVLLKLRHDLQTGKFKLP